ncbi:ATP-binding protein [Brevibacillus ginsengisoli]|uniref:sensor histidine kinase n=1 Tax=Brevibacillus ginsengisoli TaxID=363854 RepID=UPI003CE9A886
MIRFGIVYKLFLLISVFFLLSYSLATYGQMLFFEKFYQKQKAEKLHQNVEAFLSEYTRSNWDEHTITEKISQFSSETNAQVAIIDDKSIIMHLNMLGILLQTTNKETVKVSFDDLTQLESLTKSKLSYGMEVTIDGYYYDKTSKIFVPLEIRTNHRNNSIIWKSTESALPEATEHISGNVTDILFPGNGNLQTQFMQEGMMYDAIHEWFSNSKNYLVELNRNIYVQFEWIDQLSGIKNLIEVCRVPNIKGKDELAFAMTSLQPVGEAVDTMKVYFGYVFIVVFIVMVIIAFFISKMISKPLINLKEVALRMAKLDFSAKANIRSNDELGSLADSLNRMAFNLNQSMLEIQNSNEQLVKDIERRCSLENMRKDFIASASHELKTPLGIIRAFSEGVQDGIAQDRLDHYIHVILDEVEKMDELVEDMLELSKLESKTVSLKKDNFCIQTLISEVIDKFSCHLEEKQLYIHTFIDKETNVFADKKRIEQVLVNLLSNAVRYSFQKSIITIQVAIQRDCSLISVENKGKPIPDHLLDCIWERFYRVEESRGRKSGGTGLGLAIVKNILELHKSQFGVQNKEQGVSFYFTLPFEQ